MITMTEQERFNNLYVNLYNNGIKNKKILNYSPTAMEISQGFFNQYLKKEILNLDSEAKFYGFNPYNRFRSEPNMKDFEFIENNEEITIKLSHEESKSELLNYKCAILSVNSNGLDWFDKIWKDCNNNFGKCSIKSVDDFYKRICNMIVNCIFYNTNEHIISMSNKYFYSICLIIKNFVSKKINRDINRKRKREKKQNNILKDLEKKELKNEIKELRRKYKKLKKSKCYYNLKKK